MRLTIVLLEDAAGFYEKMLIDAKFEFLHLVRTAIQLDMIKWYNISGHSDSIDAGCLSQTLSSARRRIIHLGLD